MTLFEQMQKAFEGYSTYPPLEGVIDEFAEKWRCRNCKHCDATLFCDIRDADVELNFACADFEE